MSKHIQAYFQTENEAEHVRTLLQTYDTEALEVGKLDDGYAGNRRIIIPIADTGAGAQANGTGVVGAGGIAPAAVIGDADDDDLDLDGHRDLHYALSAKVLEEDYEEIRNLVRRNRGHVERVD
ncbi:hypothetical protein SAMN03159341_10513 [Paenibacillus sp. 1_12]|uniref:hypothetical protein n=1 Tax=Paenibacillus sp. 1_12 TaxID=1566278 RepID=UPI0008EF2214|nr:hypothetical protein [Paenibacillus sp. 1_12]SFL31137.1 hypothetical protein SAMN03159341_10513 [Paenibacillus sp. 1_12]